MFIHPMCTIFVFNDTETPEIYTLSLHDALPIYPRHELINRATSASTAPRARQLGGTPLHDRREEHTSGRGPQDLRRGPPRSEEHTSELQSQFHLVCRLLLEKKKKKYILIQDYTC